MLRASGVIAVLYLDIKGLSLWVHIIVDCLAVVGLWSFHPYLSHAVNNNVIFVDFDL
jgi:hypothetical protein